MDEESQIARLGYVLSHGGKEGFVSRPAEWPGANCVSALVDGTALTGIWVDRSSMYEAWRSGKPVRPHSHETNSMHHTRW